jgi:hypothetical protein
MKYGLKRAHATGKDHRGYGWDAKPWAGYHEDEKHAYLAGYNGEPCPEEKAPEPEPEPAPAPKAKGPPPKKRAG